VPVRGLTKADFLVPAPSFSTSGPRDSNPRRHREQWPVCTGTELLIRRLRQGWSVDDVKKAARGTRPARHPFIKAGGFQVRLQNGLRSNSNGVSATGN